MKNAFVLSLVLCVTILTAQEDAQKSINDFNFEGVTNPAFILLGETPSLINTSTSLKNLALNVANGVEHANFGVEFNPYWSFNLHKSKTTYLEYRGFALEKEGDSTYHYNPFHTVLQSLGISVGYLKKRIDGLDGERKTVAFGASATVLEVYGKNRADQVTKVALAIGSMPKLKVLKDYIGFFKSLTDPSVFPLDKSDFDKNGKIIPESRITYETAATKFLNNNPHYTDKYTAKSLVELYIKQRGPEVLAFFHNLKNIKPVFRLDCAVGYGLLFRNDNFDSNVHRFGAWLTGDLALKFGKKDKNYLHILSLVRRIDDGFQVNQNQEFFSSNHWDYGGKIELQIDKLKFAYEYLERDGDGSKFRSVGNITYQVSKDMSLIGGFGKDFEVQDNLITLFGINWRIKSVTQAFATPKDN